MQREWFDTYFDHNFCCFTLVCQKFSWFLLLRIKLRLDCYSWIFKYFHWKFINFELIIGYLVALLNFKSISLINIFTYTTSFKNKKYSVSQFLCISKYFPDSIKKRINVFWLLFREQFEAVKYVIDNISSLKPKQIKYCKMRSQAKHNIFQFYFFF